MKKILNSVMALAIAAMTFTACEDVPEPYPTPTVDDKPAVTYEGSGTLESPYTVADAINYAKSFGQANSDQSVYIKGYITAITEEFTTQYGNGTFEMSDTKDGSNKFTFYRGLYLGNNKFANGNTQIKVGDEVIVYGNVVNYRGNTPETVQGSAFLYSLNGVSEGGGGSEEPVGEAKGTGTLEDPFNAAAAIAYAKFVGSSESDKDVYIKGKVSSIKEQFGTQYGNATFGISDDGTSAGEFTIYRALYLGNLKYTSGDLLNVGDEVVVLGKVTCYMGNTPETVQGKAYLYSLNGKTEGGGDTPAPQPSDEVKTITVADFNAAAESNDVWYQLTGTVKNLKDGDQYGNFDLEDATGSVYVYGLLSEKGGEKKKFQELVAAKGITEGCKLTIIGNRGSYQGKIEVTNAYFVSIEGGSDNPGGGEVSGNSTTVTMESLGLDNATDLNTQTLSDGTQLIFSAEENSNAPKYYNSGTNARVYAKNSLTIKSASKNITKVVLTCTASYLGNDQLFGEADGQKVTVAKGDTDVTFSGFSSQTLKIVNDYTEAKAGTQLRVVSITITYAE
ncbi:MAG: hypothetical protein IJ533_09275 [Prevotella sp.]|nr:hypothetical protein [Prevotella sp.]